MLGLDIVNNKRIAIIYNKFGVKFLKRIFNDSEINHIKERKYKIETISGMYAAKEAISKSLGTGIGIVSFKDIIIHYNNSKPYATYKNLKIDLSISHERKYSIAVSNCENYYNIDIPNELKGLLKSRDENTYKGNYGKVAIIAGSMGMTGSAYLSSLAAIKSGSGLVYNLVDKDILDIMNIKLIEPIIKCLDDSDLMFFLKNMNSIAIGPGMGIGETQFNILKNVLKLNKPILIDADGLTNLSKNLNLLLTRKPFTTILTPHYGEFARLINFDINYIKNNKIALVKEFVNKYKCILLLKGHNTIVYNGKKIYINKSGNAGMATAGSGDVLTGIIVSFLGRSDIDYFKMVCLGTYIHGVAGDIAINKYGEESLTASNVIEFISNALMIYKSK